MLNEFEKQLLAKQAEREQKAKESIWFANKTVSPGDMKPKNRVVLKPRSVHSDEIDRFNNSTQFMIFHFETLKSLIPDKMLHTIEKRKEVISDLILDYKNKVKFIRKCTNAEIWSKIEKKFKKEYWDLHRIYERNTYK